MNGKTPEVTGATTRTQATMDGRTVIISTRLASGQWTLSSCAKWRRRNSCSTNSRHGTNTLTCLGSRATITVFGYCYRAMIASLFCFEQLTTLPAGIELGEFMLYQSAPFQHRAGAVLSLGQSTVPCAGPLGIGAVFDRAIEGDQ